MVQRVEQQGKTRRPFTLFEICDSEAVQRFNGLDDMWKDKKPQQGQISENPKAHGEKAKIECGFVREDSFFGHERFEHFPRGKLSGFNRCPLVFPTVRPLTPTPRLYTQRRSM
jgi:hypothetical protein